MQTINKFLTAKSPLLGALLILLSLAGCGGGNGCENKTVPPNPKQKETSQKAIILFHGLNDKGNLKSLEAKLAQAFKDAKVVALDRDNSATAPIKQQAEEAFQELKKQSLSDKELILYGYSQGGLLAFSLCDQHPELKVKGIITDRTPWTGAPIAAATSQNIQNLASSIQTLLKLPTSFIDLPTLLKQALKRFTDGNGAQDLQPGSTFLNEVKQKLPGFKIPVLAIGGEGTDIGQALDGLLGSKVISSTLGLLGTPAKSSLESGWEKLVTGTLSNKDHDFIVPLASAHAAGINGKPASFKTIPKQGYHHFLKLSEVDAVYDEVVKQIKGW